MANKPRPPEENPAVKTLLDMNKPTPPAEPPAPEPPAPPAPEPPAPPPEPPAPEPPAPPVDPNAPILPPEPVAPTPPEPEPEPPAPVDPETHNPETGQPYKSKDENIKALVGVTRDLKTKLQTAEQSLSELSANPPAPEGTVTQEEYDALQTQLTEALDHVAELDLSRDPRFKQMFQPKMNAAKQQAKDLAMAYGAPEDLIDKALATSTPLEQAEVLKAALPEGWVQVSQVLVEYNRLGIEMEQKLQNHQALRAELDQAATHESNHNAQASSEFMTRTFDAALTKYSADGFEVLIEVPGAQYKDWNAQVAAVKTAAQNTLKDATPETAVHTAILASTAPVYRNMYLLVQKQLAAAERQLQEIKEAQPGIRGRVPSPGGAPVPTVAPKDVADPAKELSNRVFKNREFRDAPIRPH